MHADIPLLLILTDWLDSVGHVLKYFRGSTLTGSDLWLKFTSV